MVCHVVVPPPPGVPVVLSRFGARPPARPPAADDGARALRCPHTRAPAHARYQIKDETGIGNVTEIVQYFLEARRDDVSVCLSPRDGEGLRRETEK